MKWTYANFLKLGIDLSPLGIEQGPENETYFCTPKGARVIGWAGVDGIHYCFIRGFGEMVFAVSPMNAAPHYVHPLADTFSDFLRLLLACGHTAPLEQAWQWDAPQFAAFLADDPPTEASLAVLTQLAALTHLTPMEAPWDYLHRIQTAFDGGKIPYTRDFYDPEMNPDAPAEDPAWTVSWDGGLWSRHSRTRPGREVAIRKTFHWAGHQWYVPAVYLCSQGLVVDLCMQVELPSIQAFLERWGALSQGRLTQIQQMQLEADNPMHLSYTPTAAVNGRSLTCDHSSGACYAPQLEEAEEATLAVAHYALDPSCGWVIHRAAFRWATRRKPTLRTLSLTLTPDPVAIPGPHFQVCAPGDTVSFSRGGHPHLLTVQEYQTQTLDFSHMPDAELEYPSHYVAMTYTLTPELPDGSWSIADCDEGDSTRRLPSDPGQPTATSCSLVLGVMTPADCSAPIPFGPDPQAPLHAACSSLHFAPVDRVEWCLVFYEQPFPPTTVALVRPSQPACLA